jgi:hypothetical protein
MLHWMVSSRQFEAKDQVSIKVTEVKLIESLLRLDLSKLSSLSLYTNGILSLGGLHLIQGLLTASCIWVASPSDFLELHPIRREPAACIDRNDQLGRTTWPTARCRQITDDSERSAKWGSFGEILRKRKECRKLL